jgi:hypothetical protein
MIYSKRNIRYICVYCGKTVYHVYDCNRTSGRGAPLQESYFLEKTRKNNIEKIERHMTICNKFKVTSLAEGYLACRKQRF